MPNTKRSALIGCLLALFLPLTVQAQCSDRLADNIGDTAVVQPEHNLASVDYVDIVEAWVRPASGYPATELGARFVEPVPYYPDGNFNVFFFFDADGDLANNDPSGHRAGADTAYSLMFGQERRVWHTVSWAYDAATGEWAPTESPEVLFAFDGGGIIIHVPFALMPEGTAWPWRATAALALGDESAKDSYPDEDGNMVSCPAEGAGPTVTSGVPDTAGGTTGGASDGQETGDGEDKYEMEMPWWVYAWAILIFSGLLSMVIKGFRERKKGGGMTVTEPPALEPDGEDVPGGDPSDWSQPDEPPPEKPGAGPEEWSQPDEPPPGEGATPDEAGTPGEEPPVETPEEPVEPDTGETPPEETADGSATGGTVSGDRPPMAEGSTPKVAPEEPPSEQPVPPPEEEPPPPEEEKPPPPEEEPPPPEEEKPPPPEEEEDGCRCPKCRLFITVGRHRDRAVGSAMSLGKAIKRDTLAADDIDDEDRCVKVAHFADSRLTRGRYVAGVDNGDDDWQRFRRRGVTSADGWDEICLWQEVMLVHHGESESRVRRILKSLRELIPEKPIQRLVLYYCGGEGTLPENEFRSLASELGRRLKQIPEECRPERVDIYLAPTVSFGDREHFTKLVIEEGGLVSYEGLMKHYTVDQEGVITEHGNQRPPDGQIFGDVPLGELGSNPDLDAEAYSGYWREIARLPLSDIKRYRQRIEEAGLDSPPQTFRERQEQAYRDLLGEERAGQLSEAEWDELVDIRSRRKAGRWLEQKFGGGLR